MPEDQEDNLPPLPSRSLISIVLYLLSQIVLVPIQRVFLNNSIEGWSCIEQIFVKYVRFSVDNDLHHARSGEATITKLLNLGVREPLVSLKTDNFEGNFLGNEPTSEDAAILLYLHGGGYSLCSSKTLLVGLLDIRSAVKELGKKICIFGLEYTRAPEAKYPTQIDEALSAYKYLRDKYPNHPLFIMGDSAGGNLALALMLKLKQSKSQQPEAAIAISPWVKMLSKYDQAEAARDSEKDFVSCAQLVHHTRRYLKDISQVTEPFVSPIYGDFSETCPVFVHYGGYEWLLPQIEEFIGRLRQNQVDLTVVKEPRAPHITPLGAKVFRKMGMNGVNSIAQYMLGKLKC